MKALSGCPKSTPDGRLYTDAPSPAGTMYESGSCDIVNPNMCTLDSDSEPWSTYRIVKRQDLEWLVWAPFIKPTVHCISTALGGRVRTIGRLFPISEILCRIVLSLAILVDLLCWPMGFSGRMDEDSDGVIPGEHSGQK